MRRLITLLLFVLVSNFAFAQCGVGTPIWTVDLSQNADSVWVMDDQIERNDTCCHYKYGNENTMGDPVCAQFVVTLSTEVSGLFLDVQNPAPAGSMFFILNCDSTTATKAGQILCVNSPGPHDVTICKPGNDKPIYTIAGLGKAEISPPIVVSDACTDTIWAEGYSEASLVWNSIYPGVLGQYNDFLSDSLAEDTVIVTPNGVYPDSIQYVVCGDVAGLTCAGGAVSRCDTTWVYFVSSFNVNITPENPSICFGGGGVTLTATPIGGASPYTYQWYDSGGAIGGATNSTYTVNSGEAGDYWVNVMDTLECQGVYDTVTVTEFVVSITADAGPIASVCEDSPSIVLNGALTGVTEGVWSTTGGGAFAPNDSTLNATYTLSPAEITAGVALLQLNTIGNGSCPADSDTVRIFVNELPELTLGADGEMCSNNNTFTISGSSHANGNVLWTSSGDGGFNNDAIDNPTYTIGTNDALGGDIYLTMTVSNAGCPDVLDSIMLTIHTPPPVDAGSNQEACDGESVTLSGAGATSYVWSGGITNAVSFTPAVGVNVYNVTGTDGNTCTNTDVVTVTVNALPTVDAGTNQTRCVGQSVTLSGSGATSYVWSGGITNGVSFTPAVGVNIYNVTGTDANTCTNTDVVTVTVNALPTVDAGTNQTRCIGQSVTLSGSGATSYVWSGGITNAVSFTPAVGVNVYNVTGTDANTCTNTDVVTVTVNALPTVDAGVNQAICVGQSATLSGSGATSYVWSGGITNGNSFTPAVGVNVYNVTGTDANTCTNTDAVTVTVNALPTVDAGTNQEVCDGESVTLSGSGATSYVWSSGITDGNSFIPAAGVNVYNVTGTDANTCTNTDAVTVTVFELPTADAGPNQAICDGGTVTIGGSPTTTGGDGTSYTYLWSNGASLDDNTISNPVSNATITTPYTVTVSDSNGCVSESSVTVGVSSTPTVDAGSDVEMCEGELANLGGSPTASGIGTSYTYVWSDAASLDDATASNPVSNTTVSVNYFVTVTDNNGCSSVGNVSVTVHTLPIVDAGPSQAICDGGTATLGGSPTASGEGTSYTYSWSNGASLDDDAIANPISNATITTPYSLTVTDNNGCVSIASVNVSVSTTPIVDAGNNVNICEGESTVLGGSPTASGAGTSFTYVWSNSATLDDFTLANPSSSATTTTAYDVTVTDNNGCSSTDAVTVTVYYPPTAIATSSTFICPGETDLALSGTVSNESAVSWTTNGDGTFSPDNSTLNTTYTVGTQDTTLGRITLTLEAISPACPSAFDDITIYTNPDSTSVSAGSDVGICVSPVQLNGTIENAPGGIWSTSGDGFFTPDIYDLNATYTLGTNDSINGSVVLTLTTDVSVACYEKSHSITLTLQPLLTVNINTAPSNVCASVVTLIPVDAFSSTGLGYWYTLGDGSFSPDDSLLSTNYTPGVGDTTAHFVDLVFSTINTFGCLNLEDTVRIDITPAPLAIAGSDVYVCPGDVDIALTGSIFNSPSAQWYTDGDGTFTPNSTDLNVTYNIGMQDTIDSSIQIVLEALGNSCPSHFDTIVFFTNPDSTSVFAGNDQGICTSTFQLNGIITNAPGGTWSTSGDGVFLPNTSDLNATYTFGTLDSANGSATLTLTNNASVACFQKSHSFTLTLQPELSVNINTAPSTVCASVATLIPVDASSSSGMGYWYTLGDGTFSPDDTILSTNYIPGVSDTTAHMVDLVFSSLNSFGCLDITDTLRIDITPSPLAIAGSDVYVCPGDLDIALNGSIFNSPSAQWYTTGDGNFTPNSTDLNVTYNLGVQDTIDGSIQIVLEALGNSCPSYFDTIIFFTNPDSTDAFAGSDVGVCVGIIQLDGQITNAPGGIWSTSGDGFFTPDIYTLNAIYTLGNADSTLGSVVLTLTTDVSEPCFAKSHSFTVTVEPPLVIDITTTTTNVCANISTIIPIDATSSTGLGYWYTLGDGTFSPDFDLLSTNYTPGVGDTTTHYVDLVFSSLNTSGCIDITDTVRINFVPSPLAIAGADGFVCPGDLDIALTGSIFFATSAQWHTLGDGSFTPNNTDLNTTYLVGMQDTTDGSVTIVLEALGNLCPSGFDTLTLYTNPDSTDVFAGNDQGICGGTFQLSGTVINAPGGIWSSSGNGFFTPNIYDLNATYTLGSIDSANGFATLTLTTDVSLACFEKSHSFTITLEPPLIIAIDETSTTFCASLSTLLPVTATSSTGMGYWYTLGDGIFSPNDTLLSTNYIPGIADTTAHFVDLVFSSLNTSGCVDITDTVRLNFVPAPYANAGEDIVVCPSNTDAALQGSSAFADTYEWQTDGSGSFSPNNTDLAVNYIQSSTDTANGQVILALIAGSSSGSCPPDTDWVTVSVDKSIIRVNAGLDTTICGGQIELNGTVEVAPYVKWSTMGTGSFSPYDTILNPIYLLTTADSINGFVEVVICSAGEGLCAVKTDTVVISLPDEIFATVTLGVDTVCANSTSPVNISATSSTGLGYWVSLGTGSFTPDDSLLSTSYIPSVGDTTNGQVYLIFHSIDPMACVDKFDSTLLVLIDPPKANFNFTEVCFHEATPFTDATPNSTDLVSWNWNFNGLGTASGTSATFTFPYDQLYDVTLEVTSTNGCVDTVTRSVGVITLPVADFTTLGACLNEGTQFSDASSSSEGTVTEWKWFFGDGQSSTLQNPSNTYASEGNYGVSLLISSSFGCKDTTEQIFTVNPSPVADFSFTPAVVELFETAEFENLSTHTVTYAWNFGDTLGVSSEQNPSYSYTKYGGYYPVELIATSEFGCTDTVSKTIIVTMPPIVPTGFSPNGDGLNDFVFPLGGPYKTLNLTIYNNWGEVIFTSNDVSKGWDGRRNGVDQPIGVYVYVVYAVTLDDKEYNLHGDVTLLR